MGPEILAEAVLMKCETRAQQIGLVIGTLVCLVALIAVGVWAFNMGDAIHTDYQSGMYSNPRNKGGLIRMMFMFYGGAAISGILGLLCTILCIVNFTRFVTNTGLKNPDVW